MSLGSGTAGAGEGGRRARSGRGCQVPGCAQPLEPGYSMRHRVCTFHYHQESLELGGSTVRFCQQCGRYQLLSEFESGRRSCRTSLQRHKERRRKARQRKREERARAKRRRWGGGGESETNGDGDEEAGEASEQEEQEGGGGEEGAAEQEGEGQHARAGTGPAARAVQSAAASSPPAVERQPLLEGAVGREQRQRQRWGLRRKEARERRPQPSADPAGPTEQVEQPEPTRALLPAADTSAHPASEAEEHEREQQGQEQQQKQQQQQQQQQPPQQQRHEQLAVQSAEQEQAQQEPTSQPLGSLPSSHLARQLLALLGATAFDEPPTPVVCAAAPVVPQGQQPLAQQVQQAMMEQHAGLAEGLVPVHSRQAQQAQQADLGPQQHLLRLQGLPAAKPQAAPALAALVQPTEVLQSPHTPASAAAAEPLHAPLPSPIEQPLRDPTWTQLRGPLPPPTLPAAPGAPGWSPPSPQASPCPACAALAEVWRAHMDDRQFMEQLGQPPPLCDTCAQL